MTEADARRPLPRLGREWDDAVVSVADAVEASLQGALGTGADIPQEEVAARVTRLATERAASDPRVAASPDPEGYAAAVARDARYDLLGYGPIEPLLYDGRVDEIMVNAPDRVYAEVGGKIVLTRARFRDEEHVFSVISRIVAADDRLCDPAHPLCDCTLHRPGAPFDGSRVNAVSMPVNPDHYSLDIRKFRSDKMTVEDLMAVGTLDRRCADLLEAMVRARMNIVIAGGTGSGKTTLLNALSQHIPDDQRIITIEDTCELQVRKDDVVRMEARPASSEGTGLVTIRELVVNSLRQRPDRIIVGECRDEEAFEMLQAMGTGHDGSLTTVHANSAREAVDERLVAMVQNSKPNMPLATIRQNISHAVDVVVYLRRLRDGSRKVTDICEIQGMQGDVITLAELVRYEQAGTDGSGRVTGSWVPTGDRLCDEHSDRFAVNGVAIDGRWFAA